MLVLTLLAAALGGLVAWMITRTVKQQLGGEPSYAAGVARQIAQGDLSVRVQLAPGDTSSLLRADRKSTRLNSSHLVISYAVFCLKKKTTKETRMSHSEYLPPQAL